MKRYGVTTMIIAIGIIAVVAFTVWQQQNAWALLGLFFLCVLARATNFQTICPKCDNEFLAVSKQRKNDPFERFNIGWTFTALIICALVGLGVYLSKTSWILVALFFLAIVKKPDKISTECPKCRHKFRAIEKSDEDDKHNGEYDDEYNDE